MAERYRLALLAFSYPVHEDKDARTALTDELIEYDESDGSNDLQYEMIRDVLALGYELQFAPRYSETDSFRWLIVTELTEAEAIHLKLIHTDAIEEHQLGMEKVVDTENEVEV